MNGSTKKELGDYQTPMFFSEKIVDFVKSKISFSPDCIVEPTCGIGNFIISSSKKFNEAKLIGIDINEIYLKQTKESLDKINNSKYKLINSNIFEFDYSVIDDKNNILVIGNPPWATNSELVNGNLQNLPTKTNFKNHSGFDAMTGASNFDICEYIILDVLKKINSSNLCLAMLCKTTVAINVIKELKRKDNSVNQGIILKFNAKEVFDVSVDACLLFIEFIENASKNTIEFEVYNFEDKSVVFETKMGFVNGELVVNKDSYIREIDGSSKIEWRQGVKHDASKVMELSKGLNGEYVNGFKEIINIEDILVYPLLKSSDIKKFQKKPLIRKYVIITQSKVGENTEYIKIKSPKLWDYLIRYEENLKLRKSSIYKNSPQFSIFGIGEYSFSKYKVAISGFYKEPIFIFLSSEKPIMLDDTCYFMSFTNEVDAKITTIILNSNLIKQFLSSITNINSKRPYTKKVLSRINLKEASKILGYNYITNKENECFDTKDITLEDYSNYVNKV